MMDAASLRGDFAPQNDDAPAAHAADSAPAAYLHIISRASLTHYAAAAVLIVSAFTSRAAMPAQNASSFTIAYTF